MRFIKCKRTKLVRTTEMRLLKTSEADLVQCLNKKRTNKWKKRVEAIEQS